MMKLKKYKTVLLYVFLIILPLIVLQSCTIVPEESKFSKITKNSSKNLTAQISDITLFYGHGIPLNVEISLQSLRANNEESKF